MNPTLAVTQVTITMKPEDQVQIPNTFCYLNFNAG